MCLSKNDYMYPYILKVRKFWVCPVTDYRSRRRLNHLFKTLLVLCVGIVFSTTAMFTWTMATKAPVDRFSSTFMDVFEWKRKRTTFCGGNYTGYGHTFFKLKSTVFDPNNDAFLISCDEWMLMNRPSMYWFNGEDAPPKYSKSLTFSSTRHRINRETDNNVTIVVNREYPHNFFHAMTQWYNIFLLSKLFGFDMKTVNVLLVDRGPFVHLDDQWRLLFQRVRKANEFSSPVFLNEAIFNIPGHESPMYYFDLDMLPFIEEFSANFLHNFGLKRKLSYDCLNLTITLVFRRDYYMHPGVSNQIRIAERKLKNEDELISILKSEFPGHNLRTLIAEDTLLKDQLKLTSNTDILIGMHGCVLTHVFFLPQHALVLEMYPQFWRIQRFFSSIAKWRSVKHEYWRNDDSRNEFPNHYTYVPPKVIQGFAKRARGHFACK